jgi:hypothetical protein
MDTLAAIFGTEAKVKILRLFLFNPETPFFPVEVARRAKCSSAAVRKELAALATANILKKRLITKEIPAASLRKGGAKKLHGLGFALNERFEYLEPLKNLLTVSTVPADESLLKRFSGCGRLKLFVASGIFTQNWDARVDLLIAGDELDLGRIEAVIRDIEAELGKEISYSAFETQDFEYRFGIHDRLIRDIFDYPHMTLLDRLGVEPH